MAQTNGHVNGHVHPTSPPPRIDVDQPDLNPPLEKHFSPNGASARTAYLDPTASSGDALNRIRTAGSISISPELFEKLYLAPPNKVHGDLRRTFGNPTPVALIGFLICLSPLSCDLMGWRGAGGLGAAGVGTYFFFGGLLMLLGAIGEWLLGNTFPFVVFASFGAYWLSWGATLQPSFNAYGAYSPTNNPADGLNTVGFRSSFAFFQLSMALLCTIYLICSLRTNIVFFLIFLLITPCFTLLAAANWQLDNGNLHTAANLQIGAGALGFVVAACGWWILLAIMLEVMEFPFGLPVGDLSGVITSRRERERRREGGGGV